MRHTSEQTMEEVCANFHGQIPSGDDAVEGIICHRELKYRDICMHTYLILGNREYNAIVERI